MRHGMYVVSLMELCSCPCNTGVAEFVRGLREEPLERLPVVRPGGPRVRAGVSPHGSTPPGGRR